MWHGYVSLSRLTKVGFLRYSTCCFFSLLFVQMYIVSADLITNLVGQYTLRWKDWISDIIYGVNLFHLLINKPPPPPTLFASPIPFKVLFNACKHCWSFQNTVWFLSILLSVPKSKFLSLLSACSNHLLLLCGATHIYSYNFNLTLHLVLLSAACTLQYAQPH